MEVKLNTTNDVRKLLRVIDLVRKLYPRMELGQLAVLLHVLAKPGVRANDLLDEVGVTKSALSRNVRALSDRSYLTDEQGEQRGGLDLITQVTDPLDGRAKLLAPTARGRRLAQTLSKTLGGYTNGT